MNKNKVFAVLVCLCVLFPLYSQTEITTGTLSLHTTSKGARVGINEPHMSCYVLTFYNLLLYIELFDYLYCMLTNR
jgi:hypothetical protein